MRANLRSPKPGLRMASWRDTIHGNDIKVEGGVLRDVIAGSEVKVYVRHN